jgi:hypothetical protein
LRKAIAAAGLAAASTLTALAVASPAQAAIPAGCQATVVMTPRVWGESSVNGDLSLGTTPRRIKFALELRQSNEDGATCPKVTAFELFAGSGVGDGGNRNLYVHVSNRSPFAVIDSDGLANTDAGKPFNVLVRYTAGGSNRYYGSTLNARRATTFASSFDAKPEPVQEGAPISLSATLMRANWDTQTFQRYGGRVLQYQNRDNAGGPYVVRSTRREVITNSAGFGSGTRVADRDRTHRFAYRGSDVSGPAVSNADLVSVKH